MNLTLENICKPLLIKLLSIILISILIFCENIFSQSEIKFERITIYDGLSQGSVKCILQDSRGFMWFGTQDGLNKYDGYNFKVYKNITNDSTSLGSNSINCIAEDSKGFLWIGTAEGLYKYNRYQESFSKIILKIQNEDYSNKSIYSIYPDNKNVFIWIGTSSGLLKYNSQDYNCFIYNIPKDLLISDFYVKCINQDNNGNLLVSLNQVGLWKFEVKDSKFKEISVIKNNQPSYNFKRGNNITSIIKKNESEFLISSISDLIIYNSISEKMEMVNEVNINLIPHPSYNFKNFGFYTSLSMDDFGNIWLGTQGFGIRKYNINNKSGYTYTNDAYDERSISSNVILSMFKDRSGLIWVGTFGEGIVKINPYLNKFSHFYKKPDGISVKSIRTFFETNNGDLYVGGYYGLDKIDKKTKHVHHIISKDNNRYKINNSIYFISEDKKDPDKYLWIGTEGSGIVSYDIKNNSFKIFQDVDENRTGLIGDVVHYILSDSKNNVWIGTEKGLNKYDKSNKKFYFINLSSDNLNSDFSESITIIFKDSFGNLWVGTEQNGLILLNSNAVVLEKYKHIQADSLSISGNFIKCIYEDKKGNLWISTTTGLSKFDRNKKHFTNYYTKDGLPNNVIYGILEDEEGNLWLSTNQGISKFNPANGIFRNFDIRDGLQSNEFNTNAYYKKRNGDMLFGGVNGFNSFNPQSIINNPNLPSVVITDFMLFNKSVKIEPDNEKRIILTQSSTETKEIVLDYFENVFSIEFASLDYTASEKNLYSYRLEGFDNYWSPPSTKRLATYTNIDPGKYVFTVRGSNNDGIWNYKGVSVTIIINPPYWQTWWFRLLSFLIIINSIFIFIRQRIKRLENQKIILEQQVKERTLELKDANDNLQNEIIERRNAEESVNISNKELKEINAQLDKTLQELNASHQELKETQKQLMQAEKMASLGQLTAGIAHEIKNPLNFVNNFSEISGDLTNELREELDKLNGILDKNDYENMQDIINNLEQNVKKINEHGKRADSIVKGMLLHSRGKTGERRPTNFNNLLSEYIYLAYHGIRAQDTTFNIKLETELDDSIGIVNIVPQDFSRAFLNIVTNACYSTHVKKKELGDIFNPLLKVTSKYFDDKIEVRVYDNGKGIPQKIIDKIYQPFFTTKPPGSGTGLGLSITYEIIVHEHNGTIKIETKEGEFAEFIITLPKQN